MPSTSETSRLRVSILTPSITLPDLCSSGKKEGAYEYITKIAIAYSDMEGEYASIPERVRQNISGDNRGTEAAEKLYLAAILGPQTSALLISRRVCIAHLQKWPIENTARYALSAPNWFRELATLLDLVLGPSTWNDQYYTRLGEENAKMQSVREILTRLKNTYDGQRAVPIDEDSCCYRYDDKNRSWNRVCRMVAQGDTVLDAELRERHERWGLMGLLDDDTSVMQPISLPLDLFKVAWPGQGEDPEYFDSLERVPKFMPVRKVTKLWEDRVGCVIEKSPFQQTVGCIGQYSPLFDDQEKAPSSSALTLEELVQEFGKLAVRRHLSPETSLQCAYSTPAAKDTSPNGTTRNPSKDTQAPRSRFETYNQRWEVMGARDTDIPYPSPDLTRKGFLVVSELRCGRAISKQLGLQERISINTKTFFLDGIGVKYKIQLKRHPHLSSTTTIVLDRANDVTAVKQLMRHLKRKELLRWHPDKLNRRTGSSAMVDESKGVQRGVVDIRTAVQELIEDCEKFVEWAEDHSGRPSQEDQGNPKQHKGKGQSNGRKA